jgi:hypothetical protein
MLEMVGRWMRSISDTAATSVEFLGFRRRNKPFVTQDRRRSWEVVKSMRQFRQENPLSPWSGRPVKEVHHIQPVSVAPELAADHANMIGFGSRDEHYVLGHMNVSWQTYNPMVWSTIDAAGWIETVAAEEEG